MPQPNTLWHLFNSLLHFWNGKALRICYIQRAISTFWSFFGHFPSATRCRGDVIMTSLCRSQWCRRYVSNETPNDISVAGLHDALLVCRDDVSWGRNGDVPSVRLHDVSNKSQMKHPMTSQWYVTKTSSRRLIGMSWWRPMGT